MACILRSIVVSFRLPIFNPYYTIEGLESTYDTRFSVGLVSVFLRCSAGGHLFGERVLGGRPKNTVCNIILYKQLHIYVGTFIDGGGYGVHTGRRSEKRNEKQCEKEGRGLVVTQMFRRTGGWFGGRVGVVLCVHGA